MLELRIYVHQRLLAYSSLWFSGLGKYMRKFRSLNLPGFTRTFEFSKSLWYHYFSSDTSMLNSNQFRHNVQRMFISSIFKWSCLAILSYPANLQNRHPILVNEIASPSFDQTEITTACLVLEELLYRKKRTVDRESQNNHKK